MSVYDPYPGRYSMYRSPSIRSYIPYTSSTSSYTPSRAYSAYTDDVYSRSMQQSVVSERMYFSLNGKLVRSQKMRSFRQAQKHVLDLFPEVLQGIASSRIQFYVTRPGYDARGMYVGFKSYISKQAWLVEMDSLAEHETVGIEVRPSVSVSESVSSFFNRSRFI